MQVSVTEYNPQWPEMYSAEAEKLAAFWGEGLVAIHHIGSTSVPGMAAKPVIDMLPVVVDLEAVDKHNAAMEELGYQVRGEFGIPGRRFFSRSGQSFPCHVHTFQQHDCWNIDRHLAVRDYLRAFPAVAREYSELKKHLAFIHHDNRPDYISGKEGFVLDLQAAALKWYGGQGT